MNKIPDDVMAKAVAVKTLLRFTPEDQWGAEIARAIMAEREAERERCAKVADGFGLQGSDDASVADDIAAAIRKG